METTHIGRWVTDFVQVRILGATGGFETAGICHWTDERHDLVRIGDLVITPESVGEIVEGGVIRIDWTAIGTMKMMQDMARDMEENPDDYEEEDSIFEGDDDALLEWLEQCKPEIDEEGEDHEE